MKNRFIATKNALTCKSMDVNCKHDSYMWPIFPNDRFLLYLRVGLSVTFSPNILGYSRYFDQNNDCFAIGNPEQLFNSGTSIVMSSLRRLQN